MYPISVSAMVHISYIPPAVYTAECCALWFNAGMVLNFRKSEWICLDNISLKSALLY